MAISPTQRSLKYLREQGFFVWIVEHWNSFAHKRQDLFGFIDLLAIKKGTILGVQTTSYSNVSERVHKINEHENVTAVRESGMQIHVHGWHKVGKEWQCRIVDLTEDNTHGKE